MLYISENISSFPEELRPDKLMQFEDILTISTKEGTNILQTILKLRDILDSHFAEEIEYPLEKWKHDLTEHRKINETR
jgi:hypothetical protein